jgi:cell division inhibitor SulA
MLMVNTHLPLWAHEQALRSGACGIALAWLPRASPRAIRRLQLAAEQGRALGCCIAASVLHTWRRRRCCACCSNR